MDLQKQIVVVKEYLNRRYNDCLTQLLRMESHGESWISYVILDHLLDCFRDGDLSGAWKEPLTLHSTIRLSEDGFRAASSRTGRFLDDHLYGCFRTYVLLTWGVKVYTKDGFYSRVEPPELAELLAPLPVQEQAAILNGLESYFYIGELKREGVDTATNHFECAIRLPVEGFSRLPFWVIAGVVLKPLRIEEDTGRASFSAWNVISVRSRDPDEPLDLSEWTQGQREEFIDRMVRTLELAQTTSLIECIDPHTGYD